MKKLRILQNVLIGISLFFLMYLPLYSAFGTNDSTVVSVLYQISFISVFLVMIVRPLADIFSGQKWLRKLVFLRKGFGILSASIIVGFVLGNIIAPGSQYLSAIFTAEFWSLGDCNLFAHIGDLTGIILLITSNNLSMILLKKNWKRIQKLAYVYFYAGGVYELCVFESAFALYAMLLVGLLVIIAFIFNRRRAKDDSGLN